MTLIIGSWAVRARATSPSSLPFPAHIRCRGTANPAARTASSAPSTSSPRSPFAARLRNEPTGPAGSACASYSVTSAPVAASATAQAVPATPPPAITTRIVHPVPSLLNQYSLNKDSVNWLSV